jgi:hypothetical protein
MATSGTQRGKGVPAVIGVVWASTVAVAIAAARYAPSVVATPHAGTAEPLVVELVYLGIYVMVATVGGVVALRRPRHLMGWIFLISAWLFAISELAHGYAHQAMVAGNGEAALAQWAALVSVVLFLPPFVAMLLYLPLIFPDGRLLSPRWRIVVIVLVSVVAILSVTAALDPWETANLPANPLGLESAAPLLATITATVELLFVPLLVAIAASVVLRFRRAAELERQQFKWVALPAGVLLVFLPLNEFVLRDAGGAPQTLGMLAFFLAFAGLPIGLAIAVLRYRLYDIDRVLSRTVSYVILSLVMVALYAVGVLALGSALRALTGDRESQLVVALSTLSVAAVFHPTRRRIQDAVDRRFNRAHYDAAQTVERFLQRLRNELDPEALLTEIRGVVVESVQPATTSLWVPAPPQAR